MNKNKIRICGKKMITLPTPAITPSTIRLESIPAGSVAVTSAPRAAVPASMRSMSGVAQANTA